MVWTAGDDVALEMGMYRAYHRFIDLIGEDVLMYASDYRHGERHFPHTVEMVMGWDMPQERKRKLFGDNAVRYYACCGSR